MSELLPLIYLSVNLSDVLFKFIHALILYFTFKLRNITILIYFVDYFAFFYHICSFCAPSAN